MTHSPIMLKVKIVNHTLLAGLYKKKCVISKFVHIAFLSVDEAPFVWRRTG